MKSNISILAGRQPQVDNPVTTLLAVRELSNLALTAMNSVRRALLVWAQSAIKIAITSVVLQHPLFPCHLYLSLPFNSILSNPIHTKLLAHLLDQTQEKECMKTPSIVTKERLLLEVRALQSLQSRNLTFGIISGIHCAPKIITVQDAASARLTALMV